MDEIFNYMDNPLIAIIMDYMIKYDIELFTNKIYLTNLNNDILNELRFVLVDMSDTNFLAYGFFYDKIGDYVEIRPYNLVTSLWFLGIFPDDNDMVEKENKYVYNNKLYSFDKKNKKLVIHKK